MVHSGYTDFLDWKVWESFLRKVEYSLYTYGDNQKSLK